MDPGGMFKVFRARPSNAKAIAEFVTMATRGRVSVGAESVLERSGTKGLWVVRDAEGWIVGIAGWRAENLIARIDDFLVFPPEMYTTAGRLLMESLEAAAEELQCEVSMLFVPLHASPVVIGFYESCGYERPELDALPRVWQETVQEATEQGRYIMLKRLRENLVMRPI